MIKKTSKAIKIIQINSTQLSEYAKIPISFNVRSEFNINLAENNLDDTRLKEIKVKSYLKNYDKLEGKKPTDWIKRFNISKWGLFLAYDNKIPIAGAVVAFNTPGVRILEGKNNLAVLWDLRIHPSYRGSGLGTKLFQKTIDWAKSKDCIRLKIETQNTNVPACKFYKKQGCRLGDVYLNKHLNKIKNKNEITLIWYLDL